MQSDTRDAHNPTTSHIFAGRQLEDEISTVPGEASLSAISKSCNNPRQSRNTALDVKLCYRTWETEKGLNSQPWRMHEVLAENRMDKETLQRAHFQHMPEAVHTFHEFLHRRSTVDRTEGISVRGFIEIVVEGILRCLFLRSR